MDDFRVNWMGFPVVIENPAFRTVLGETILDIDPAAIERKVCEALVFLPSRLTGVQVKFIRHHMGMTQAEFALALGQANHSGISQWEGKMSACAQINPGTEILLRMLAAYRILGVQLLKRAAESLPGRPLGDESVEIRVRIDIPAIRFEMSSDVSAAVSSCHPANVSDWACSNDSELGFGRAPVTCTKSETDTSGWPSDGQEVDNVSFAA